MLVESPLALSRKQYVLKTYKPIQNFLTYLSKSGCLITSLLEVIIWLIMDPAETKQVFTVLVNQDAVWQQHNASVDSLMDQLDLLSTATTQLGK